MEDPVAETKKQYEPVTEFGRRNPFLAALVPDQIENAVDAMMPDAFEKVLDRGCEKVYNKYQNFKTDLQEGIGEVAGVLFKVAKYAYEKFHFQDLVFGVYHLALHHATVDAADAVEGRLVDDEPLIKFLIGATDAAAAAYCPTKKELAAAAGVSESDILLFEPETTTTRPAYAVWVDAANKRLIWAFRGTTDLNDMLTDACASCSPYCGGFAHWGMLQAADWFAENELAAVKAMLDERQGYELLLVGHSLGAGTAAMLAHVMKNDAKVAKLMSGVKFQAVGVATPAVLTEALAEGCSDYITSVVLQHDVVPRFSIYNVFSMKEEMDATEWGDILKTTLKDWAVPDVIEKSETYKRLARRTRANVWIAKRKAARTASQLYLDLSSYFISWLHFLGLVKPNPEVQQEAAASQSKGLSDMAAATAATAKAALTDASVVAEAVNEVKDQLENVTKDDVHQVFAPGRLFFIRRLDKYKGRAKYGNMEHRCVLCKHDDAVPKVARDHTEAEQNGAATTAAAAAEAAPAAAAAAAADSQIAAGTDGGAGDIAAAAADQSSKQAGKASESIAEFYPGAKFELIEAAPSQRFKRIVLRETCLMDHLCGGYVQGLQYALKKAKAPCTNKK